MQSECVFSFYYSFVKKEGVSPKSLPGVAGPNGMGQGANPPALRLPLAAFFSPVPWANELSGVCVAAMGEQYLTYPSFAMGCSGHTGDCSPLMNADSAYSG
jgi:hypothetical protein